MPSTSTVPSPPPIDPHAFRDTYEALQVTFQAAAKSRPDRPDFVDDGNGFQVPAWVIYERKCLWVAVNLFRAENHLDPVTLDDIRRVEQMACGHSDYSTKYPLYCAELAFGRLGRP